MRTGFLILTILFTACGYSGGDPMNALSWGMRPEEIADTLDISLDQVTADMTAAPAGSLPGPDNYRGVWEFHFSSDRLVRVVYRAREDASARERIINRLLAAGATEREGTLRQGNKQIELIVHADASLLVQYTPLDRALMETGNRPDRSAELEELRRQRRSLLQIQEQARNYPAGEDRERYLFRLQRGLREVSDRLRELEQVR
jgi:DNA-binding CsgD family transcriptional regulator